MKKNIYVIAAIGLLLLSSIIVLPVSSEDTINIASGTTLYVDDDNTEGPWNGTQENPYQHIQDGIDNASSGDTVFVYEGNYSYSSIKSKSINLIGENRDSTVVNGIYLDSNKVNISGFKICNAEDGIFIFWGGNHIISDNIITNNFRYGINIERSNNNVSHNIISDNGMGVRASGPNSNIIKYNKITNNNYGIYFLQCKNNIVSLNDISENNCGLFVGGEESSGNNQIGYNNFIRNNQNTICKSPFSFIYTRFDGNYWNRPRLLPYFIPGPLIIIPCNIDLHPALKPCDI